MLYKLLWVWMWQSQRYQITKTHGNYSIEFHAFFVSFLLQILKDVLKLRGKATVFQVSLVQIFYCCFYASGNPQECLGLEKMPNSRFWFSFLHCHYFGIYQHIYCQLLLMQQCTKTTQVCSILIIMFFVVFI
jgi:hypothetical protein